MERGSNEQDQAYAWSQIRRPAILVSVCSLFGVAKSVDTTQSGRRKLAVVGSFKRRPEGVTSFFADDLFLFVEATPDQARCIKEGLEGFYQASG